MAGGHGREGLGPLTLPDRYRTRCHHRPWVPRFPTPRTPFVLSKSPVGPSFLLHPLHGGDEVAFSLTMSRWVLL